MDQVVEYICSRKHAALKIPRLGAVAVQVIERVHAEEQLQRGLEGREVLLLGRTAGASQMAGNMMGSGEPERMFELAGHEEVWY